jgi:hypothetical protein
MKIGKENGGGQEGTRESNGRWIWSKYYIYMCVCVCVCVYVCMKISHWNPILEQDPDCIWGSEADGVSSVNRGSCWGTGATLDGSEAPKRIET